MSKIGHEYDLALARRALQIHKSSRAMYLTFLAIGVILTFNNVIFFHPIVNALIAIFCGFMAWGQHLSVEEFKRAVNDNENALKKQNAKRGN